MAESRPGFGCDWGFIGPCGSACWLIGSLLEKMLGIFKHIPFRPATLTSGRFLAVVTPLLLQDSFAISEDDGGS
jgi:hypothetical protein